MQLLEGDRDLGPSKLIVVPRGVEHCPLALTDEVHVVLLEPKAAVNTGNVRSERTVEREPRIRREGVRIPRADGSRRRATPGSRGRASGR
jgi:hypothetical protein